MIPFTNWSHFIIFRIIFRIALLVWRVCLTLPRPTGARFAVPPRVAALIPFGRTSTRQNRAF